MNSKQTEEPACNLSNAELIDRVEKWVHKLAETGGQAWTLRVPVDFNHDPDMLIIEVCKRFSASLPSKPVGDVDAAAPQKGMEFVEWQLCPKCNGDGNLARYNSPSIIGTDAALLCDICKGAKMIPKIALDESPSPSEAGDGWVDGNKAPMRVPVLVFIRRKGVTDEVKYEIHVGCKQTETLWVIGNHFGFDMGEVICYRPLPAPPIQKTVK